MSFPVLTDEPITYTDDDETALKDLEKEEERARKQRDMMRALRAQSLRHVDHRTEVGNGARFAAKHADTFRYVADRKIWVMWDGRRWRPALETELIRAAVEVTDDLRVEAARIRDYEESKKAFTFAMKSASAAGLKSMIKLAASELDLEALSSQFDRLPMYLNVANGTVDLFSGDLRPHRREDMLTRLTPIKYDPAAKCPRWDQFLREVFAGDEELIAFVQRAVGYSLTGETREQAFFVAHGGGRNGKGRFIRQTQALLGDAARTTAFSTFTADRAKQTGNTPELAALAGARLVCAGEPDEGVRLSESTIKSLTGEDEIMACAKYEAPFTFTPQFKIWLHTNHKPEIRGTDDGIWRRPRLIPFNAKFEGANEDKQLDSKLDAECEGILAWAVEGARQWYASGLGSCEAVRAATATYREESDPIGQFIGDYVVRKPGAFVSNAAIFERYERWCAGNGVEPSSMRTFSQGLARHGLQRRRDALVRGFVDVEVRASDGG